MGGCSMNSVCRESANKYFDKTWIMPSPGDASSALGCVLAHTKSKIRVKKTIWSEQMLNKIKNFLMYPYTRYKQRQMIKKRLEELRKKDPFIYEQEATCQM